ARRPPTATRLGLCAAGARDLQLPERPHRRSDAVLRGRRCPALAPRRCVVAEDRSGDGCSVPCGGRRSEPDHILGEHYLSDCIGAMAEASLWLAICLLGTGVS